MGQSRDQSVLTYALIIRVRDLASILITSGDEPPMGRWKALEDLRERYDLHAMV
ncbi:hypothetical protein [Sphaerimonospora mesophila]|uniref:hypothetical protein n=1 Tax=Sphaerimonospora mesophila TaxID=37483 RepID=UPI000A412C43